jgi:hypothetical protein
VVREEAKAIHILVVLAASLDIKASLMVDPVANHLTLNLQKVVMNIVTAYHFTPNRRKLDHTIHLARDLTQSQPKVAPAILVVDHPSLRLCHPMVTTLILHMDRVLLLQANHMVDITLILL